jgi:hypothetical protein
MKSLRVRIAAIIAGLGALLLAGGAGFGKLL